jgi:hypothetical protein
MVAASAGAIPAFRILLLSFPLMCLNHVLRISSLMAWSTRVSDRSALALVLNVTLQCLARPSPFHRRAAWATL